MEKISLAILPKVNIVDLVASVMPWAGGLVPATMTYRNVQINLGYQPTEALILGIVVEGIGFVSVTTALDLYEMHQASKGSWDQPKLDGQFWVAVGVSLVYLVAVISVNAILDNGDFVHRLTNALLSIFGLLGGILVALRNQLGKQREAMAVASSKAETEAKRIEEEIKQRQQSELDYQHRIQEEEIAYQRKLHEDQLHLAHETELKKIEADNLRKLEKIKAESLRHVSAQSPEVTGKQPETSGEQGEGIRRWTDVPESDWEWIANSPASAIVAKYHLRGKDPDRVARSWKKYAKAAIAARGGA